MWEAPLRADLLEQLRRADCRRAEAPPTFVQSQRTVCRQTSGFNMTSLVTGASGFIGSHLVELLRRQGQNVVPLSRRSGCDLLDRARTREVVGKIRPGTIYHLAAQSLPRESWADPQQTFRVNVEGTLNLLDAVRNADIEPRIVVACSSAEYALADDGTPIREDCPLQPSSPYGASKVAVDHLAQLYGRRYGMQIVRARPFFLIGPVKTGDVCSDFARGIVAAERSGDRVLRVGNLDIVRDLLDVADGVKGFLALAERGQPGEVYNVCSGHGYRLREVLSKFKALARVEIEERVDPSLLRPIDEKVRIGDPSRLQALGWRADLTIDDSLRRILEYWRSVS